MAQHNALGELGEHLALNHLLNKVMKSWLKIMFITKRK